MELGYLMGFVPKLSFSEHMMIDFKRTYIFILIGFIYVSGFSQTIENKKVSTVHAGNENSIKSDTAACANEHSKPRLIAKLPSTLNETSGLVMFDGLLWTINDSGNPAEIYQIDTATGQVLKVVKITNAQNHDWEGLAQDNGNVYIGDFGNNAGNRTNLQILIISKSDLLQNADNSAEAEIIRFSYPDQTDFSAKFNGNNFDCEAFFYFNDSLHLFTKNWGDKQCKHYTLPSDTGIYEARFIGQFNADGLITDASINEMGNIVLLGYKNTRGKFYTSFAWLFAANNGIISFTENKRRIEFGSVLHVGQSEGIFLKNDNSAFISSESILNGLLFRPAKLLKIDLDVYFEQ